MSAGSCERLANPRRFSVILIGGFLTLLSLATPSSAADAPREEHGSADAYAGPGVALAWAVLRGANDESTQVVLRIAADASRFPYVAVSGVDPFTQQRRAMLPATPVSGAIDVRTPRSRFADFPRSEVRLYPSAPAVQAETPALVVFYLGVPDTTPEFDSEAKLDAYLAGRINRVRAEPAGKAP